MIRTTARKAILLAAATLSVGALAVNCSHKDTIPTSDVGSVGLAITLPSGATVSSVHYSVKNGAATEVAMGDIPVADSGATISVVIGGVAAGTGYTVTLSGTASDGSGCLGTSAPFTVVANASTSVNVLLLCRGAAGNNGTVTVAGQIDNCPAVTSYVVSPMATGVNGHIGVSASASDPDAGDVVTYAWTATAGSFAAPSSASTTFTCPATSSVVTLTITVSDSTTTTTKCNTSSTIVVNCGLCGNGTLDTASGEQCDPPNGTTCNNSCQTIATVCGNSIVQPGEQCDPPNGTTCSTTCQNIAIVCGNSIVQPGEQCDPPNGTTCSATCQTIAMGTGGTGTGGTGTGGMGTGGMGTGGTAGTGGAGGTGGTAGTAGSAGAGGTTSAGGTAGSAGAGGTVVTASCTTCETNICVPQGVGCSGLTGTAQTACLNAVTCIRNTHCDMDGDTSYCYCGTADQNDGSCTSAPLGLCITQLEAADPNILSTDNVTQRANKIFADLVDTSLPIGKATGLIGCDAFSCNTAATCSGQF